MAQWQAHSPSPYFRFSNSRASGTRIDRSEGCPNAARPPPPITVVAQDIDIALVPKNLRSVPTGDLHTVPQDLLVASQHPHAEIAVNDDRSHRHFRPIWRWISRDILDLICGRQEKAVCGLCPRSGWLVGVLADDLAP